MDDIKFTFEDLITKEERAYMYAVAGRSNLVNLFDNNTLHQARVENKANDNKIKFHGKKGGAYNYDSFEKNKKDMKGDK